MSNIINGHIGFVYSGTDGSVGYTGTDIDKITATEPWWLRGLIEQYSHKLCY